MSIFTQFRSSFSLFDQERISEQLEGQRQEQALQRYHNEAKELDHWLLSTRATLSSALQPINQDLDMEEQLIDCQVRFFKYFVLLYKQHLSLSPLPCTYNY